MSNLYLIERIRDVNYDEYLGFVIATKNPAEARKIARDSDYQDPEFWTDNNVTKCTLLATKTKVTEGVVLESYNAG